MTLKSKTTPWFAWTQKPVRVGVYQREFLENCLRFSYWDGHRWGRLEMSPFIAETMKHKISALQKLKWRGLVEEK